MAMASLKFEPFDGDDIESYLERLQQHFISLEIDGNEAADVRKQKSVLLSSINSAHYKKLKDLCHPTAPAECTYAQLTGYLKQQYAKVTIAAAEQYKFHHMEQQPGQSVQDFASELKSIAAKCEFDGASLDTCLRIQLVHGIRAESLKQKLLTQQITFNQALKQAIAYEAATKSVKDMGGNSSINKLSGHGRGRYRSSHHNARRNTHRGPKCDRCGFHHHSRDQCKYVNYTCQGSNEIQPFKSAECPWARGIDNGQQGSRGRP